jgi:ornithine carbamoyltransferase
MTSFGPLGTKDLLRIGDLAAHEVQHLLATAAELKADPSQGAGALAGRSVCMLFEKPSLRTRTSFEVGIFRLGGQAIVLDHQSSPIGERESIADCARNLERWCHAIVARVKRHSTVVGLADAARVPVVNALCDMHHPCQALADFQTLLERGFDLRHDRLAWIGDGNNVCHSLMHAATMLGVDMTVVTPKGYEPTPSVVEECLANARAQGSTLAFSHDPAAVEGHHAVYTDVWVSMGQSDQANERRAVFAEYCIDASLMSRASKGVTGKRFPHGSLFMHCLPAQRGVEVTDEVIDAPSSIVYDQAENRMHAQNALLLHLFGKA